MMIKLSNRLLVLVALFALLSVPAVSLTLKLSSPLPEGSEWDRTLRELAREWTIATNGKVRIKIYPGGVAGAQSDVIRKMRLGQLDMAVLASTGMAEIVPDSLVMNTPFLLSSEQELDYVLEKITPLFQERYRAKGFVVLGWSKSGWLNIFSTDKIKTPEDLKQIRLAIPNTDPLMANAFKKLGFTIVPLDWNGTVMALQSGMIEAFFATNLASAAYQWFALAPNLLDLKIAPVLGGMVITERKWQRVPEEYHVKLIEIAERIISRFQESSLELEESSMDVMIENGLTVHTASTEERELWRALPGQDYSAFVGEDKLVSKADFGTMQSILDEFHSR